MFRFSDTDSRLLASEIKPVDEALQRSLKSSVPGLVHMQSVDGGTNNQQSILPGYTSGSDERFSSSTKHRTLIPPNAFNVSTLFQPTLAFIERAISIIPPGFEDETGTFGSVLEDFVVKVFLPQLDEKVTASFQQAVSGTSL
jgi:exocyst complex component 4